MQKLKQSLWLHHDNLAKQLADIVNANWTNFQNRSANVLKQMQQNLKLLPEGLNIHKFALGAITNEQVCNATVIA